MNLKKRKDNLKNIILNDEFSYDTTVYRLINTNCLDNIISKLDNMEIVCDINPNNKISADVQFLQLLNRFVVNFKNTFPTISVSSEYIIESIIYSNQTAIEKYLLSKYYLGDSEHSKFFYNNIYKLFIINFINNKKYILLIEDLLKEENIKVKNIEDYEPNEILNIKNLLSCLVFCSWDKYSSIYLFNSIDCEVVKFTNNKDCDYEDSEYKKSVIENFKTQYQFIIRDYKKRKKYLKYFKY